MRQSKVKQKKPNLTKILVYVWSHCKQGATKCSSKQPKIATDFTWFIRVTGILSGYVRLHAQSHCKLPIQMVRANVTLNQIKLCLVKLQQYFALCPNFLQIFWSFLQSSKRSKKTTKSSVKQPKLITSFADFKESSEYFLKNTTVKSCCKLSIYIYSLYKCDLKSIKIRSKRSKTTKCSAEELNLLQDFKGSLEYWLKWLYVRSCCKLPINSLHWQLTSYFNICVNVTLLKLNCVAILPLIAKLFITSIWWLWMFWSMAAGFSWFKMIMGWFKLVLSRL